MPGMHEDVIGLFDLACRLRAEAAHGGCNGKLPYRRADRHMLIVCQAHGDGFNRHLPFVHSIPAAPPEAKGSLRPPGRLHLVSLGAAAVCLLIRELPDIAHAREKHHQTLFVCTDVRVIRQCNVKRFLLAEHPRGIACGGLRSAEDEKARGFLAVSGINDRAVRRCDLHVQRAFCRFKFNLQHISGGQAQGVAVGSVHAPNVHAVGIRIFYSLAGEAGAAINDEEHRQSCQQRRKHSAGQNSNFSLRSHFVLPICVRLSPA